MLDGVFEETEREFSELAALELGASYTLYCELMSSDPSLDLGFTRPSESQFAAFRDSLGKGMSMLRAGAPRLAAEIAAIIQDIVVLAGDKSRKFQFDGGSHFQLWGGLFLNGEMRRDEVGIIEVLAHECAHSLLFGFCSEEYLVENEDEELYCIYHATFVSARIHGALNEMLSSGILDAAGRERAREANAVNMANFYAGHAVIAQHGRLSSLGCRLMRGATDYMARVR